MTPEPLSAMRRATALAVNRCVIVPVKIGLKKSSRGISTSGVNWMSRIEMALNDTSTPPHPLDYLTDVPLDGPLVEGVDHCCLGLTSGRADLPRYPVELVQGAAGQKDPRPFPGEGAGDRAADGASRTVDHDVLALE